MTGLVGCHEFVVVQKSKFFKSMKLCSDPYSEKGNRLILEPNNLDSKAIKSFVKDIFYDLGVLVRFGYGSMSSIVRPPLCATIEIPGDRVRIAILRLFERGEIGAHERSVMGDALKNIDRCLDLCSRSNKNISLAQKDILIYFIDPYLQVIKKYIEFKRVEKVLDCAAICIRGFKDPEHSFKSIMSTRWVDHCPVVNKEWSPEIRSEVLESLYLIGRVWGGMGDLENAFMQSGYSCPSLETQYQIIIELLNPAVPLLASLAVSSANQASELSTKSISSLLADETSELSTEFASSSRL